MADELFDILNEYPILWTLYPILLTVPLVLLIGGLVICCIKGQHSHDGGPPPSSNNKKTSRKGSAQSTDSNDQKKATKVRYIVRSNEEDVRVEPETADPPTAEDQPQWNYPPTLDDFNLMDLDDVDPSLIEDKLNDNRLIQLIVRLQPNQGVGLSIVGGKDSTSGDAPIYIKRILPDSVFQMEGKLKTGDELIAVNDILLIGSTKEHASDVLNNLEGHVRILVIQDL